MIVRANAPIISFCSKSLLKQRYEDETNADSRTAFGITNAITASTDAKRKSLTMAFTKFLSIANSANGKEFLSEICYVMLILCLIFLIVGLVIALGLQCKSRQRTPNIASEVQPCLNLSKLGVRCQMSNPDCAVRCRISQRHSKCPPRANLLSVPSQGLLPISTADFGAELPIGHRCGTLQRTSVPKSSPLCGAELLSGLRCRTPHWNLAPNSSVDFGVELLIGLRCQTPQWTSVPNS